MYTRIIRLRDFQITNKRNLLLGSLLVTNVAVGLGFSHGL
jgi:hypothetical protein